MSTSCVLPDGVREALQPCILESLTPGKTYQARLKEVCVDAIRSSAFGVSNRNTTYQETAGKPLNVRSGLSAYTKSLSSLTNITKIEKISPYNLRFHVIGSHGFKQGSSIVIENVANKEIRVVNSLKKTTAAALCFEGIKYCPEVVAH